MEILLQGQLAVTSGQHSLTQYLTESSSLEIFIQQLSETLPDAAKALLVNDKGDVRKSLFVAIDGEHFRDYSTLVPTEAKELMLMPPMAGG